MPTPDEQPALPKARKPGPNNDFEHVRFNHREGPEFGLRISCIRCGRFEDRPLRDGFRTAPQAYAERMFQWAGWRVGLKRKNDVCPDCVAQERSTRERRPSAPADQWAQAVAAATAAVERENVIPLREVKPKIFEPAIQSEADELCNALNEANRFLDEAMEKMAFHEKAFIQTTQQTAAFIESFGKRLAEIEAVFTKEG